MQQQGIRSVMPQGMAPGQAPMPGMAQPMPGMMPPQQGPKAGLTAFVPSLVGLEIPQMMQIFGDPSSQIPKNRVLAAIVEKQKQMAAQNAVRNQMAMSQGQQAAQQPSVAAQVMQAAQQMPQAPVMAAHGGLMQGYAGGGAVAFQTGTSPRGLPFPASPSRIDMGGDVPIYAPGSDREPGETEAEYLARKQKEAAEADEVSNRPLRRLYRYLAEKIREPSPVAQMRAPAAQAAALPAAAQPTDTSKLFAFGPPETPMMPVPEIQIAPSRAASGAGSTGTQRQQQQRPQVTPGLSGLAEQPPTPAPNPLNEIEAEARTQSEGLQKLLASQAQVDPRIVAARKEAAELAQRGIGEREKRAAGALEAAGRPLSQNLFDNQEALFRMLGAMKGGKRIGDAFSSIGQEAGNIRGEQRKALETAQRENRLEQNALDQLRQAQADLRLAQETNDVTGERAAALKVEEAKANLINTRLNIQEKRATEADRAEQRRLTERGQNLQQQTAREQMANALKVAQTRGALAGEKGALTPRDIARFRAQAEKDVDAQLGKDPGYVSMKVRDPAGAETYRTKIIDERLKRVLAEEGYGDAASPPPAGKEIDFNAIGKN
jgi:hypothetical protein